MAIDVLCIVIFTAAALPSAAMLLLALECLAALLPPRPARGPDVVPGKIGVLMPAHNEASGIAATLASVAAQLSPTDRIWVVADNCSDATAEIAAAGGATVLERFDPQQRGKGFALEFGLRAMASDPPDVLIICDADIQVEPGALKSLAAAAAQSGQPVQAAYLMIAPASPTPRQLISQLAFTVKNLIRPLGLQRLGMVGPLSGTGMAFPWDVAHAVKMDTCSIVEDMQLAIDMLLAGYRPIFCSEARVTSTFPQEAVAAHSQRRRWEHGHLQVILTQVPRLLFHAARQCSLRLLVAALEIAVPPIALLTLLWGGVLTLSIVLGFWIGEWRPALMLAGAGLVLVGSMLAALWRFAPREAFWRSLRAVPQYVLSKVPLYASFLVSRQKAWVRTERGRLTGETVQ